MRVIAKSTLKAFWEKHADAEIPLKTWYKIVEKADDLLRRPLPFGKECIRRIEEEDPPFTVRDYEPPRRRLPVRMNSLDVLAEFRQPLLPLAG